MRVFGHHHHGNDDPLSDAPAYIVELYVLGVLILERLETMATKEQLDKLRVDVAALITAGVAEITAAVAAAQAASPDPAIDELDSQVTAATQALTDAAAKLASPPASPPGT